MSRNTTTIEHISVIIPVYNETDTINATINHVQEMAREVADRDAVEIIVSDGGPGHETLKAIDAPTVIKVESRAGRGKQLNAGAVMAQGDILLFLHADTRLPKGAFPAIQKTMENGGSAGAFSLAIDSPKPSLALIAWFANLRTRIERVPYGDQAQFIRAEDFHRLGGYADIPIMEDVEFFKRVRIEGLPITILPGKVMTSARRWDHEGVLRRTLSTWWLRLRYALGASPTTLVRHYRPPHKD